MPCGAELRVFRWQLEGCFMDDFHVKSPTTHSGTLLEAFANPVPADIKEWDEGQGLQST